MFKRDRIFFAACGVLAVGVVLGVMGYDLALLFIVAAYLLRPALHSFGMAKQYADERQLQIHSKSGNVAFIVVIMATVGFALLRIAKGELAEEMYSIIAVGLAARALVGLLMAGDLRRAGAVIITAIGILLGAFIVLDAGTTVGGWVFGVAVAAFGFGIGWSARRMPQIVGGILAALVCLIVVRMDLYRFSENDLTLWLLGVTPLAIAAACLWLSRTIERDDGPPASRVSRAILLSAGSMVAIVFVATIHNTEPRPGAIVRADQSGNVEEIQGVACIGRIEYFTDGTLESCVLGRQDTLFGQILPESTTVTFRPDSTLRWCFLPHDIEIEGHLCRGEGHGFTTGFHPNGRLQLAWLARDEVIQGVPCARFVFAWLRPFVGGGEGTYFHDNGRLASGYLAKDHTIGGRLIEKGTLVRFDRNGQLINEAPDNR
ncbi:MAG: hypothetical protein ABIE70_10880 [bacterium]